MPKYGFGRHAVHFYAGARDQRVCLVRWKSEKCTSPSLCRRKGMGCCFHMWLGREVISCLIKGILPVHEQIWTAHWDEYEVFLRNDFFIIIFDQSRDADVWPLFNLILSFILEESAFIIRMTLHKGNTRDGFHPCMSIFFIKCLSFDI